MVMRIEHMPKQTLSGTTGTFTTGKIHGKILGLKIIVDASTTFKIYTANAIVAEYIFGTSSAAVTVGASAVYYPRVIGNLASTGAALGASNVTNAYVQLAVDSALIIDVVGSDTKVWSCEIFYED